MPPSSSAVAGITPTKVPASSCLPPVSWSHRPPSWFLLLFTEPGLITGLLDTGLLECPRQEERAMGPLASRQRELLAMELLVEAQTSMVVSIGLVAVNRSALAYPLELPTKALLLLAAPVGPSLVRRHNQASIEHRGGAISRVAVTG